MNKISKLFLVLALVLMAFSIGYKVGDSRGYTDGYNEGYRYDCRAEIASLYEQVKSTRKAVEFTDRQLKSSITVRDSLRNMIDSLRYPVEYRALKSKIHEDTLKYGAVADRRNDSLRRIGHPAAGLVSRQSGVVPGLVCLVNKDDRAIANLPECKKFLEGRK